MSSTDAPTPTNDNPANQNSPPDATNSGGDRTSLNYRTGDADFNVREYSPGVVTTYSPSDCYASPSHNFTEGVDVVTKSEVDSRNNTDTSHNSNHTHSPNQGVNPQASEKPEQPTPESHQDNKSENQHSQDNKTQEQQAQNKTSDQKEQSKFDDQQKQSNDRPSLNQAQGTKDCTASPFVCEPGTYRDPSIESENGKAILDGLQRGIENGDPIAIATANLIGEKISHKDMGAFGSYTYSIGRAETQAMGRSLGLTPRESEKLADIVAPFVFGKNNPLYMDYAGRQGTKEGLARAEAEEKLAVVLKPGSGIGGILAGFVGMAGGTASDMRAAAQVGGMFEAGLSAGKGSNNPTISPRGGAAFGKPNTVAASKAETPKTPELPKQGDTAKPGKSASNAAGDRPSLNPENSAKPIVEQGKTTFNKFPERDRGLQDVNSFLKSLKEGAKDAADAKVVAKVEIDGKEFYGMNKGVQHPFTELGARPHAEIDALGQAAVKLDTQGKNAVMWVTESPCAGTCLTTNLKGTIGKSVEQMQLNQLIVHTPSETIIFNQRGAVEFYRLH
ncbi:MAG: deaminase [Fischerella sp. CENA71]|nr:deaminase [Fischerella sp. CENA71]